MTPIIETALSLVFVFLLLSMVASWINELLAGSIGIRGKFLRKHLSLALDDRFNQKNWGEMVYTHPSIDLLARRDAKPPAYIPPDLFAIALMDIIADEARQTCFIQDPNTLVIETREVWLGTTENASPLEKFNAGLLKMKDSDMKQLLEAMVLHNPNDTEGLKINIMNWYNHYMGRVTGWYKRKTRFFLFVIGLFIAVIGNIDTLRLTNSLYYTPQVREATLKAVDRYLAAHPDGPERELSINPQTGQPYYGVNAQEFKSKIQAIDSVYKELETLQLPIGWNEDSWSVDSIVQRNPIGALLGWLLTAFAISFGAPFWFDALKSLVNVRNTGVRPDTSKYVMVPPPTARNA